MRKQKLVPGYCFIFRNCNIVVLTIFPKSDDLVENLIFMTW